MTSICSDVDVVVAKPCWTGVANGAPPECDLAVLHLELTLGITAGTMGLSVAGDAVLEANDVLMHGYPAFGSNCLFANLSSPGIKDANLNKASLAHQVSDCFHADSAVVKTHLDLIAGESGSAIFFCKDGCRNDGPPAEIAAVMAGFIDPKSLFSTKYMGGASVPGHITWISNNL